MNKNTPILIIGMHRSGTSCLAGSLQQMGLFLGNVSEENPHNRKGNRENSLIMELNDKVLSENNGSWDNPPSEIKWSSQLIEDREIIIGDYKKFGKENWGFKDPRTLITLPFWLDGFEHYRFIGTFRNPNSVARSLYKRNGIPFEKAIELWEIYNKQLLDLYNLNPFPIVSFDVSKDEYLMRIRMISEYLGLDKKNEISNVFFEETLRNDQDFMFANNDYSHIASLYNELKITYENQNS